MGNFHKSGTTRLLKLIVFQNFFVSNRLSTSKYGDNVQISLIGLRIHPTELFKVSKIRNLESLQLMVFQIFAALGLINLFRGAELIAIQKSLKNCELLKLKISDF